MVVEAVVVVAVAVVVDPADVEIGDALMLAAAFVYLLYDIQTYYWGWVIPQAELVMIQVCF